MQVFVVCLADNMENKTFKVIFIGSTTAGKSALWTRFCYGYFSSCYGDITIGEYCLLYFVATVHVIVISYEDIIKEFL